MRSKTQRSSRPSTFAEEIASLCLRIRTRIRRPTAAPGGASLLPALFVSILCTACATVPPDSRIPRQNVYYDGVSIDAANRAVDEVSWGFHAPNGPPLWVVGQIPSEPGATDLAERFPFVLRQLEKDERVFPVIIVRERTTQAMWAVEPGTFRIIHRFVRLDPDGHPQPARTYRRNFWARP